MKAGVAITYIATTVNVATTCYCHAWQRTTMVAIKPQQLQRQTSNGCNALLQRDLLQPLATNVIWLQHLPFATKLGLLQRFFTVVQGLEVSSVTNEGLGV